MPGYGFSGKPTSTGLGPERMGRAWDDARAGWATTPTSPRAATGAFVVDQMGVQAPEGLLAIHTNMPATVPADVDRALQAGDPPPASLSADGTTRLRAAGAERTDRSRYARMMAARPQTLYGIADSPVGLAAWLLDHNDAEGQPATAVASSIARRAPRAS